MSNMRYLENLTLDLKHFFNSISIPEHAFSVGLAHVSVTRRPSQHINVGPKGVAPGLISGAHLGYPTGTQLILSSVSMVARHGLAQMGL